MTRNDIPQEVFRIWIAEVSHWQPDSWRDLPEEAVVLELAEPRCFSSGEAMAYIEGHNRAAIGRRDHRWAVAVPVVIAYQGDPRPGERISPRRLAAASWRS
ncbi:MAG TPA: hypothetical protein VGJ26_03070 [Pirellulales bacterium]|jgi:hypothetical protein